MHDRGRTRADLLVVQRREDVLRVAAVDAVAVAIEHEDVDEVREAIDLARVVGTGKRAIAGNLAAARGRAEVHPDLVGIDGALGQRVAEAQRADHDFDDVGAARLQSRQLRAQYSQRRVEAGTAPQREQVDPHFLVGTVLFRAAEEVCV